MEDAVELAIALHQRDHVGVVLQTPGRRLGKPPDVVEIIGFWAELVRGRVGKVARGADAAVGWAVHG